MEVKTNIEAPHRIQVTGSQGALDINEPHDNRVSELPVVNIVPNMMYPGAGLYQEADYKNSLAVQGENLYKLHIDPFAAKDIFVLDSYADGKISPHQSLIHSRPVTREDLRENDTTFSSFVDAASIRNVVKKSFSRKSFRAPAAAATEDASLSDGTGYQAKQYSFKRRGWWLVILYLSFALFLKRSALHQRS